VRWSADEPLLDAPWILDTDTTIKPLYGRREDAVIDDNPKKPGRPSHAYHTDLMAGLRQVLGVEVRPGSEPTAKHVQAGLLRVLDGLPAERKPRLVRGDSTFGNDPRMTALFVRLTHTKLRSNHRDTPKMTGTRACGSHCGRDARAPLSRENRGARASRPLRGS
jgi:hypothetical protein